MYKCILVLALGFLLNVIVKCELEKRDVHHRIIIQERIPRKVKPHPHHHHHKSHRHHDDKDHSEEYKKKKHRHSYERDHSFEDNSDESSSYEYVLHKKPTKTKNHDHHHRKPNKKHTSKHKHHHPTTFHSDETFSASVESHKHADTPFKSFKDSWNPVTTEDPFYYEKKRNSRKKRKYRRENEHHTFPTIDITTAFPQPVQFPLYTSENGFSSFQSTLYPPIDTGNVLSAYPETNTVPFDTQFRSGFIHKPFQDKNKYEVNKKSNNYEVHEPVADLSSTPRKPLSFQALLPIIDFTKTDFNTAESQVMQVVHPVGQNQSSIVVPTTRRSTKRGRVTSKPRKQFN